MQKSVLHASNLAYELTAAQRLIGPITLDIRTGDRIGLIGRNGVGKSTLLKLLAGYLAPTSGAVTSLGTVHYLPQVSSLQQAAAETTVLDVLTTATDEWWTVGQWLEERLEMSISLSQPINSLSGGEMTRLLLAIALFKQPDVLLLDEPTNHLDFWAMAQLERLLQEFTGALVLVSHKPFFLDQVVNTIWELSPNGLKVYGGNYSFYQTQKENEHQAALRSHEVARKELKRAREALQDEQKRAARSRREGRRQAQQSGMGKMAQHYFANRASATAATASQMHQETVAKAMQTLEATKLYTPKATQVVLRETSSKRRTLIDLHDTRLMRGATCLIEAVTLRLTVGDRLTVAGANGTGKSSLVQAILSRATAESPEPSLRLDGGSVQIASDMRVVYLDQSYALVNRNQTVIDNMRSANPSLEYRVLRQQLGHFLFFEDAIHKPAGVLSGGELARLAIALISISDIDWLVLDEPTNNLDWETVNVMIEGLNHFQGAMWVISHDLEFLSQIGITHAYKLQDAQLQRMHDLPNEPESYYRALLSK